MAEFDFQMSRDLPESTRCRCFLKCFGLIDTEANLFKAGLLMAMTDIEGASDQDLLAAGLSRYQIRILRRVFMGNAQG